MARSKKVKNDVELVGAPVVANVNENTGEVFSAPSMFLARPYIGEMPVQQEQCDPTPLAYSLGLKPPENLRTILEKFGYDNVAQSPEDGVDDAQEVINFLTDEEEDEDEAYNKAMSNLPGAVDPVTGLSNEEKAMAKTYDEVKQFNEWRAMSHNPIWQKLMAMSDEERSALFNSPTPPNEEGE